jgi:hypothetical protein
MHVARVSVAVAVALVVGLSVQATQPQKDVRPLGDRPAEEVILLDGKFEPPSVVLDDFHIAASQADFKRYFSHWTEQSVFLGTDASERWVGEEFRAFARPHFESGKGWTYSPRDRRFHAATQDVVYFDELLEHEKLGTCRGSGIMQRVGGAWKILQYNLSIPIPNEKAADVVRLIRGE